MNAQILEHALADSMTLADLAQKAGITRAQARELLAALADLPIRQAIRIATTAKSDRVRKINRATRKDAER